MSTVAVNMMVDMPKPKVVERSARDLNGWPIAGLAFVLDVAGIAFLPAQGDLHQDPQP
jgi:hypothetical protein